MAEAAVESGDDLSLRVGVLVPCRDESRVVLRRLENLALCRWPTGEHRVVVIDDGSVDGTLERAEVWGQRPLPFEFDAIANEVEPGKAGAIRAGLAELGDDVDLIVLTDADVVVHPGAILALEAAFAAEPELGLACGAQRFAQDLASDGSLRGASLGGLVDASTFYDRVTSRVRALESRVGKLVSVHGQLLGWRRELGLAPRSGLAADDLDLVFQARRQGARVRRVAEALFVEERTAPGENARAQGLRRARAWFQVFAATPRGALGGRWVDRAQELVYRVVPRWLPELGLALLIAVAVLAVARPGIWSLGVVLASLLLLAGLPLGRIWRARSSGDAVSDRWSMKRGS